MLPISPRLLLVDDEPEALSLLERRLAKRGYEVAACQRSEDALERAKQESFDVIVTDLRMPGLSGIELCERIVANRPEVPVIVMTGFGSLEAAVAAIRAGAYDFVTKPVEIEVLELALERAVSHRRTREELRRLRERVTEPELEFGLIGNSPAIRQIVQLIHQLDTVDSTVLITGESGTGKEVVARAIHASGRRSSRPFVAVNCSAVPEPLLESELFGHARGAFTDARTPRAGLFVDADGGTLFLDEVGELPLPMQPKLLRALQERRVRPLGSNTERSVDVRLIAATNTDLDAMVQQKRFREDLFYRVNVIRIELPPLRARGNDVLLLAHHFVERFARELGKPVTGVSQAAAQRLLTHSWPGNVRELQNTIERAVALTRHEVLTLDDLPERIQSLSGAGTARASTPDALVPLEVVELRYVRQVYEAVGGNKSLAAQILGLDRKTLYRKLDQCGLGVSPLERRTPRR